MLVASEKKELLPFFNQKTRLHFIHWVNVSSLYLDLERFTVYSTNCRYLNDVQLVQSSQQSPTPQPGQITFSTTERRIDNIRLRSFRYVHTSPSPPIKQGRVLVRNTPNEIGDVFNRCVQRSGTNKAKGRGDPSPETSPVQVRACEQTDTGTCSGHI
jgi:hypothetical protein